MLMEVKMQVAGYLTFSLELSAVAKSDGQILERDADEYLGH